MTSTHSDREQGCSHRTIAEWNALEAEVKALRAKVAMWEQRFDRWQDWRTYEALDAVQGPGVKRAV